MDYKLVIIAGDAKQKVVNIKPPTIIGRSREVDIPVGHPLVSRKHCEITVGDDGVLIVEDLGSLNGTYHGDQRISEPVYLEPGDTLTVGSITFQAQYGDFQDDQAPPVMPSADADTQDVDDDEMPDFLSAGADDDDEDVEDIAEEASEDDGFPDFEASAPETEPAETINKKRRPPPPVMDASADDDEEEIESFLDLPEDEDEEFEEVEVEDVAEVEEEEVVAAEESTSDISVGEEHESADIEEEVEVAAGDSSSGESGSGMNWLTGDEEDGGDSKDSGLDDFFKSI